MDRIRKGFQKIIFPAYRQAGHPVNPVHPVQEFRQDLQDGQDT
jgi:hypothetical protein